MFGDVGGLMDLFSLILASIFGFYSDKFLRGIARPKALSFSKKVRHNRQLKMLLTRSDRSTSRAALHFFIHSLHADARAKLCC